MKVLKSNQSASRIIIALVALIFSLGMWLPQAIPASASALTIDTIVLRPGVESMSYEQTLEYTGGTAPYTWTYSGSMPSGLTLGSSTGKLSGTPTAEGKEYTFTVTVTDNASVTDSQTLTLNTLSPGYLSLWGYNNYGQLGNDSTTKKTSPTQPEDLDDGDIIAIASGGSHSLAVDSDGAVYAWGYNASGQLGNNSTTKSDTPEDVYNVSDVVAVAAGNAFSLALDSDGCVWSWGENGSGQLGLGSTTDKDQPEIISKDTDGNTFNNIVAISAGYDFTVALKADGTVWTWGNNTYGQLGDGTLTKKTKPIQIDEDDLSGVVAIAAGKYHVLALDSDGDVWSWGYNAKYQLGDGSTTTRKTPVQVDDIEDIIAIAAGDSHSLAVDEDGAVYAWGYNNYGQLGTGSDDTEEIPEELDDIDDVVTIAAGGSHSLAIDEDGSLWAWGSNSSGQLGIGSTTNKDTPQELDDSFPDGDVYYIDANSSNSMAISADEPDSDSDSDLEITTTSLGTVYKNKSISNKKVYADGGNPPYTDWEILDDDDGEEVQDYLDIDWDEDNDYCTLSGKFTSTGTYDFTIEVTDDDENTATQDFSLTVKSSSSSSSSSSDDDDDDVSITTSSLSAGTVDTAYSQTLNGDGGSGDYYWTVYSGSLPAGLTIGKTTGQISGTPTKSGSFTFSIKCADQDSSSNYYLRSYTLVIKTDAFTTVSANGFGTGSKIAVSSNGITAADYQLATDDNKLSLSIPSGAKLLNSDSTPISSLSVSALSSFPTPPSGYTALYGYTLEPSGATFSPALTLTFTYQDSDLPSGVAESSLYISYYNGSQWKDASSTVSANANTVKAQISHFSSYVLLYKTSGASATSTSVITATPTKTSTSQTPAGGNTPGGNQVQPTPNNNQPSSSGSGWIWIVVIVVVVIIALVLVALIIRKRSNWGVNR